MPGQTQSETSQRLITADMLADLPEPVRRYLSFSGILGRPMIETVRLKQEGTFRLGAERPWMPMTAVQTYTTRPPGLVWNARFKVAGLPLLRAKDRYQDGRGHMFGKLAGLITVFDARGPELDQATMVRYLNEIMWFPTAFLAPYITWEDIDGQSARVTFTDQGKSVSAQMFFDADGRLTNFTAKRYRESLGQYTYDTWSTPILAYGHRAGLQLPVRGQAVWNLEEGDLVYADVEITEVEYNREA